ncbi:hypothetical protein [Paenirhodobacter hankyongi]|uniref:Uncharacterized protein n=1 Tax=Paenirhodobacter hankyongi TaxID=2294033 RepID=A0A421BV94_9RHOB|nr:hypothetical protein [Sinirhodobacter hankyongi]RLL72210.1 hypothetical protein DYS74_02005 [Sinirhodobacter hankyongi]
MEILPKELLAGLRAATQGGRRRSRLRIQAGAESWPVLRRWRGGFALDAAQIHTLRGLVDLYEGSRHLATCLIVASEIEGDELICTVKRETAVTDRPPLDFVRDEGAPAGRLPPA